MILELLLLIASIVLGIALYWLELQNNGLYRSVNKLTHSKETQMKPESKKGFIIKQPFIPRFVYMNILVLLIYLVIHFFMPFIIAGLGTYSTMIIGIMVGIYAAEFLLGIKAKSSNVLEKVVDKGKDFIEDIIPDQETEEATEAAKEDVKDEAPKKSGRERLKDKGYLK